MTAYMQAWETLGLVAHRGGELIVDPLLSVGVVVAVCRASALQLELVARRPLDDRSATRRQADTRNGTRVTPAPRVLLPPNDEGMDLRIGWFDTAAGRVRWAHPAAYERSSGNASGPVDLLTYLLPPLFQQVDLVFAWPEIGFAERTVSLKLPSQEDALRASISIWDAPPVPPRLPTWTHESSPSSGAESLHPEDGTTLVEPQVLWRSDHAVVVLTRLSRHERALQVELIGYARESRADIASAAARAARQAFADRGRTVSHGGLMAGIVNGDTVHWDPRPAGQTTGGPGVFETTRLSTLPVPRNEESGVLRLAGRWPAVGLTDTEFVLHCSTLAGGPPVS